MNIYSIAPANLTVSCLFCAVLVMGEWWNLCHQSGQVTGSGNITGRLGLGTFRWPSSQHVRARSSSCRARGCQRWLFSHMVLISLLFLGFTILSVGLEVCDILNRVVRSLGYGIWVKTWKKRENGPGICLGDSFPGGGDGRAKGLEREQGAHVTGGEWAGLDASERSQRPDHFDLQVEYQMGSSQESVANEWTSQ